MTSILTQSTLELIKNKNKNEDIVAQTTYTTASFVHVREVNQYLNNLNYIAKCVADLKEVDANLRLAILKDLASHYQVKLPEDQSDKSISGKLKLALLALIGTAYHICNGFAGGASILSLFLGVPGWAIMAFGIFLSLIYILLFLYIDLETISANLNVKFFKSKRLIDIYLQQDEYLKLLITKLKEKLRDINENADDKILNHQQLSTESIDEAQEIVEVLLTLQSEREKLIDISKKYNQELERGYVKFLKLVFPLFTDALFFSYGFFTGEAMIPIISASLHTSLAITSIPGIILCIFAGFAALSLYWLNDRLNVENLIGIWVGLDINKIQLLPKKTETDDEAQDIKSYDRHVKVISFLHENQTTKTAPCSDEFTIPGYNS